ncbi:MAG TPA: glycosyltransferase family 4 protein [Gemmatales bacterium]|nr:glycosyltransferase family 4 protein [Gemmatales bacterium]
MRIASITAGAGGMYCGSCMKDNTLANALHRRGHECLMIPCYTPLRLDEPEAKATPIFLGGLTMYLQQQHGWLRRIPSFLARWMASPWLLRKVSGSTVKIDAAQLAPMTLSMLKGTHGYQRSEVNRLIDWLVDEVKPEVILLTNVLLSGIIPELKRRLNMPVFTTLQGDDIFLEELPAAERAEAIQLIRQNCEQVTGHIATCRYYADFMAGYLGLDRDRMRVVYPGIDLHHFASDAKPADREVLNIGYLARIAPEKGFHVLVEALSKLHQMPDVPKWQFHAAGYCAGYRKDYLEENRAKAQQAGWGDRFSYVGEPDRAGKAKFLQDLDVLSVPTTYQEPKGLYVLEAWACGVPVVQPAHGSFPELIEASQGGLLVTPHDTTALAEGLAKMLRNALLRRQMGEAGRTAVQVKFSSDVMAQATLAAMMN